MAALNVPFSDDELADLRAIARERGTSMTALIKEATANDIANYRALKEGAAVFREHFAASASEFAAAFPDEEPRPQKEQAA
jgi:hypothetical protein